MATLTERLDQAHPTYAEMLPYWDAVAAVLEAQKPDTEKKPNRIKASLNRNPIDVDETYNRRCKDAVFSPWYQRLRDGVVGLMLRHPIMVNNASPEIESDLQDVNLLGDNLQSFASSLFKASVDNGWAWIQLEYPDSQAQSLADARALGDRPYWSILRARAIDDWRYGISSVNGRQQYGFTYLKQKSEKIELDDEGIYRINEYCYEYTLEGGAVQVQIYRRLENDSEWSPLDSTVINRPFIPFVPITEDSKLLRPRSPAMFSIAQLNIQHFQLGYLLDNILWQVAHPIANWFVLGEESARDRDEMSQAISSALTMSEFGTMLPIGASAQWMVCPSDGVAPIVQRIEKVEALMGQLSLATLTAPKNVAESGISKQLDRVQSNSIMSNIAQSLQDGLNLALWYHAQMRDVPEAPMCEVNRDFDPVDVDPQILAIWNKMVADKQMTLESLLFEIKRLAWIGDHFDPDQELEKLAAEREKDIQPQAVDFMRYADQLGGSR